ncbi:hypothetical protein V6N13_101602 [Hibiscus sabdariffa]
MFATSWRPIRPQKKIILQGQRADPDSFVPSSRQGDVVGAVISNLKSVLKLISEMVLLVPECKRFVTQILNVLLLEKGTHATVYT